MSLKVLSNYINDKCENDIVHVQNVYKLNISPLSQSRNDIQ